MSNAESNPHLEVVQEEEPLTKDEILNYLIAIGVNACNRSYDAAQKEMRKGFLTMPLKEIAPTWDHLEDQVKIAVITEHVEEFKAWVNGG
jgi:hypothetical protein